MGEVELETARNKNKDSRQTNSNSVIDPERPACMGMVTTLHQNTSNLICFDLSEPELWIFMAKRFFIFPNTPENQKLIIASFTMQGVALKWFLWMESSNYLSTWPAFVQSLLEKFNPTTYTIPGGKLSKLSQTSTMANFVGKFEDFLLKWWEFLTAIT